MENTSQATSSAVTVDEFTEQVAKMPSVRGEKSIFDYASFIKKDVMNSLADGTSPFLPNEKGIIDCRPTWRMNNKEVNRGLTQLVLKTAQAKNGWETGEFVSLDSMSTARKNAKEAGRPINCAIKKGEHGVQVPVRDDKTGKTNVMVYFNAAQLENPDALREWYSEKMTESRDRRQAIIDRDYGGKTKAYDENLRDPGRASEGVMQMNDTVTRKSWKDGAMFYLAQVFAGMSTGNDVLVADPKAVEIFKTGIDKAKPIELVKLCNGASSLCKEYTKSIKRARSAEREMGKGEMAAMAADALGVDAPEMAKPAGEKKRVRELEISR